MSAPFSRPARMVAGMIAILAAATFALQVSINDGSPFTAFVMLFRFFTIWSNFAAGAIMAWVATGRGIDRRVLLALATALSVVALVYHALLAADHHPVGLDWWTNLSFHTLIPASVIGWWMAVTRKDGFQPQRVPFVMIAPVLYTVFALGYGELSGFYAYFFIDKSVLGWPQLVANIVGLAAFFMAMGVLLMGLRSLIWRRRDGAAPSAAA